MFVYVNFPVSTFNFIFGLKKMQLQFALKYFFLFFLYLTLSTICKAQTFSNNTQTNLGLGLTDTVFIPINVSGVGTINNTNGLASVCLSINHNSVNDLVVFLKDPLGRQLPLLENNNFSGANLVNTCFNMGGVLPMLNAAPYMGSFKPKGNLGWFNNVVNANGIWHLGIVNTNQNIIGQFIEGSITFNNLPALYPTEPACNSTPVANQFCQSATPICNLVGFCGTTANSYATTPVPTFPANSCFLNTIKNNSFLKFKATATAMQLDVLVKSAHNTEGQDGIQLYVFDDVCSGAANLYSCNNALVSRPTPHPVAITGLTVGQYYIIMFAGYGNTACNFMITGVTGANTVHIEAPRKYICPGESVTLTASGGDGISYTWAPATGLNTTTGNTVIASPVQTTTYTVTASGTDICPSTKTIMITVNPDRNIYSELIYPSIICQNTTSILPQFGTHLTGDRFSSSPPGLVINTETGEINPFVSNLGIYEILYLYPATICDRTEYGAVSVVTIAPITKPITQFTYPSIICNNANNITPILATGFTEGGEFTSTNGLVIDVNTGIIDAAASIPGVYTITYTMAANNCNDGGSSTANIDITSNSVINTNFTYPTNICNNNNAVAPILTTGFTTGGIFSSTNGLVLNAATGIINAAASTPNTYTITYTLAATSCTPLTMGTATISIAASGTANTNFNYPANICINTTNPVLPTLPNTFTTGGIFTSSNGLIIDANTGAINAAASTPDTYTILYAVAANGCTNSGTGMATVTVNSITTPIVDFSYENPVCNNTTSTIAPALSSDFALGGTFSSTAGLVINSTTGVITPNTSTANAYTVTYTLPAQGCTASGSSTARITITPTLIPNTQFSYSSPVCNNVTGIQQAILANGFTSGGSFSSTNGLNINQTTGAINVAASNAGNYIISYSVPLLGCNPAASGTTNISITVVPTVNTNFSYPANVICKSSTNTTMPLLTSNFTSGGVFSSTNGLNINPTTGAINPLLSATGMYSIVYTLPATACTNQIVSMPANINIIPQLATPVTNDVMYCKGDNAIRLTATSNTPNAIFNWYNEAGNLLPNAPIPGTASVGVQKYFVTQLLNGSCESDKQLVTVTINDLPIVNAGTDQNINYGSTTNLNGIVNGNNVSYVWLPLNITNSLMPIIQPLENTTYTLTATNNALCKAEDKVTITVLKKILIPNTFTPNNDGLNDTWVIPYLQEYTNASVIIYNRYGQEVFKSIGYATPWDGKQKGIDLPIGTYYYTIQLRDSVNNAYAGFVTVIR
jgi:gliding motility-associated-like protein